MLRMIERLRGRSGDQRGVTLVELVSVSAILIILAGVETALLTGCAAPIDTKVFCRIAGKTRQVSIVGNDLAGAKVPFEFAGATPAGALFQAANRTAD